MFFRYFGRKQLNIIYNGPPLAGRHTNIQYLRDIVFSDEKDKPRYSDLFEINGEALQESIKLPKANYSYKKLKFSIQTIPMSHVCNDPIRNEILSQTHGVVFVVDSQTDRFDTNFQAKWLLDNWLSTMKRKFHQIPLVVQYNKRDLQHIEAVEFLEKELNPNGSPYFESIATKGEGVIETFQAIAKLVLSRYE